MADDADLTRAFAAAVEELEGKGFDRKQIAARLHVEPPTVSRYVTGKNGVQVEHLPIIDAMCGERRGYVLRLAGFVEDDVDVRSALRTDPALDADERESLVRMYDGLVELRALRESPGGAEGGAVNGPRRAGQHQ